MSTGVVCSNVFGRPMALHDGAIILIMSVHRSNFSTNLAFQLAPVSLTYIGVRDGGSGGAVDPPIRADI